MAVWEGFVGGTYQARSPVFAADQAINVYLETRQVDGSPKQRTLYGTPGLALETTVGTTGCRGWFTQDDRTWVVVGATLYERTAAATYTSLGTITDDGFPVSFASNGQGGDQLAIVGGGAVYVYDLVAGGPLTTVSLPFVGPVMIVFQDGYGLVNQADSPIVWFSAIEDFTDFDALDFFTRSGTSDNVVALAVTKDRVWTIGSKTTTLFYDSGDADTPWLPYPGTTMQVGIVNPWLLSVYHDTLYWVGRSAKGQPQVWRAVDATAQPISTPPIEMFLSGCSSLEDAEALCYAQDGHTFYTMTCPSTTDDVCTYAFDVLENLWHARAGWNSVEGVYTRWRARGCTAAGQEVLVGDYLSGAIYALDLDTFADNGAVLMRERVAPYLGTDPQWAFLNGVQLLAQSGVGIQSGQGSDPEVELLISRDGARTWISAGLAALGAMGQYLTRTHWDRLGRVRQDLLVLRIRQSDPVKTAWTGLALDLVNGTGRL